MRLTCGLQFPLKLTTEGTEKEARPPTGSPGATPVPPQAYADPQVPPREHGAQISKESEPTTAEDSGAACDRGGGFTFGAEAGRKQNATEASEPPLGALA